MQEDSMRVRPVVVPYSHRVAHNLKKVTNKFNVPTVFSVLCNLASLCPRINNQKQRNKTCGTQHAQTFVGCKEGVEYQIPLTCGKVYIGQTGRCFNERLKEHEQSLEKGTGSNLPIHCKKCKCMPHLRETVVLDKSRDSVARELKEAFFIKRKGLDCISELFNVLYESEVAF